MCFTSYNENHLYGGRLYGGIAYMAAISAGQNLSLFYMTKKLNCIWRPPMLTKPLIWRVKFEDGSVLCLVISPLFPVNNIVGGPFAALGLSLSENVKLIDRMKAGESRQSIVITISMSMRIQAWENCRIREGHLLKSWKLRQSSVKETFEIRQTWRCRHSFRIMVFEFSKPKNKFSADLFS